MLGGLVSWWAKKGGVLASSMGVGVGRRGLGIGGQAFFVWRFGTARAKGNSARLDPACPGNPTVSCVMTWAMTYVSEGHICT